MKSVVPFSALYLPPRNSNEPLLDKSVLIDWTLEADPQFPLADPSGNFSPTTGEYTIPIDGLYTLIVQLIPINGAPIASAARHRQSVHYALRLISPPNLSSDQADYVDATYLDVGSTNFGELIHLKAGTRVACLYMPGARKTESVRMKIELIQRKLKRSKPQLTRKQAKRRRNQNRKRNAAIAMSDPGSPVPTSVPSTSPTVNSAPASTEDDDNDFDDYENDSWSDSDGNDWESGFESDSTTDELPHSNRNVRRLAKRFRSATTSPSHTQLV